ncbi:hypothetical protein GCM10007159_15780 [Modicisalibacter luteus]|nr:hypothetical protein GCM10007159_15780 [Halomonas lutea]
MVADGIDGALLDEELPPGMITVDGDEGVVEIENGQAQRWLPGACAMTLARTALIIAEPVGDAHRLASLY